MDEEDQASELEYGYVRADSMEDGRIDLTNKGICSLDISRIPPKTVSLFLDKNKITTMPEGIDRLQYLRIISIGSQLDLEVISVHEKPALLEIPPSISNLTALSELYLYNNALQSLPPSMRTMTQLQVLDMRMNKFLELPVCVCDMYSLTTLRLCGNKLKTLPMNISELKHLQKLTLSQNKLETLPECIGELSILHTLDLRANSLWVLPNSIDKLRCLNMETKPRGLLLEDNPINVDAQQTGVPEDRILRDTSRQPRARKATHVSGSYGPELLESALQMKKGDYKYRDLSKHQIACDKWMTIQALDVSGNSIETVNPDIRSLINLETIFLHENHITEFPLDALKDMRALRKLNINQQTSPSKDGNYKLQLRSLTSDMPYISHLTHLHAAKNEIESIPYEIKYMDQLVELDLTDNKFISDVPDEIGTLSKLTYLGLSGNRISRLPSSIGQLTHLRVLRLSSNKLESLPDEITELTNLMTLSLHDNELVYLPLEFDKLKSLIGDTETENYMSPLMNGRTFPCSLSLRKNPTIRFPRSACHRLSAQKLFEEYRRLRHNGRDIMQERFNDAKKHVRRIQEKRWQYLDEVFLADMSRWFGYDWRPLAFTLGFNQEECEQLCENHHRNIAGSITEMLIKWRDRANLSEVDLIDKMLRALSDIQNESAKTNFIEKLEGKGWKQ